MLLSKDENLNTSSVYVGYSILEEIKKHGDKRVTIYDLSKSLRAKNIIHSRQIYLGLMFLYSCGIVEFNEPYFSIC